MEKEPWGEVARDKSAAKQNPGTSENPPQCLIPCRYADALRKSTASRGSFFLAPIGARSSATVPPWAPATSKDAVLNRLWSSFTCAHHWRRNSGHRFLSSPPFDLPIGPNRRFSSMVAVAWPHDEAVGNAGRTRAGCVASKGVPLFWQLSF